MVNIIITIVVGVITSYSIHYTKLYDAQYLIVRTGVKIVQCVIGKQTGSKQEHGKK